MCAEILVISSQCRLSSALVCSSSRRCSAVFISSTVIATSRFLSSVLTWGAVAVQALRPVAEKIRALFAAVVVLMSAAATLASVAASGDGPQRRDWKNLGHRLSRSSLMEEWPLLSHLANTLWVALGTPHTSLTVLAQQFISWLAGTLSSLASMPP